jgi:cyclin-dependent kinase 3
MGFSFDQEGAMDIMMSNEGTDLLKILTEYDLTVDHARRHIYQILNLLAFIHKKNISHRDIKPSNILIKNDHHDATLCDWGAARMIRTHSGLDLTHYIVTRWYRAPEIILRQKHYTPAVDMWSLGLVMVEYAGLVLLQGDSEIDQLLKTFKVFGTPKPGSFLTTLSGWNTDIPVFKKKWKKTKQYKKVLNFWGPEGADLITKMLKIDPTKRISAVNAFSHPFFYK